MNIQLILYLIVLGAVRNSCGLSIANTEAYWRYLPSVDFSLANAQKPDVIYTLLTNSSPDIGTKVTEETSDALIIDKNIPTILICHGWTTDDTSVWYRPLRDEYFKRGLHINIIYLNWSKAGNQTYDIACANCKPVGKFIAQFLIASKVDLCKVHLVGHSLGAQLTGFIGKSIVALTGGKIGRITALDPASPKWNETDMLDSERLTWSDADFVDVIHTDMKLLGFRKPIGHVDFYPNQAKHQPGCPLYEEGRSFYWSESPMNEIITIISAALENPYPPKPIEIVQDVSEIIEDNCNHARSTLFFIESVGTKVLAKEGLFYEDENGIVTITPKINGKMVLFGQHVDKNSRGVYYLTTNPTKPFLNKIV